MKQLNVITRKALEAEVLFAVCPRINELNSRPRSFLAGEEPLGLYVCTIDNGPARGGVSNPKDDKTALTPCSTVYAQNCQLYNRNRLITIPD